MFADASWQEWPAAIEHLGVTGGLDAMIEGEHHTACPNYNLLSDAIEIRRMQCSRYELVSADDDAYTSTSARRQHIIKQPFRQLAQ